MECGSAFKVANDWMHTGEEKITQKDVKNHPHTQCTLYTLDILHYYYRRKVCCPLPESTRLATARSGSSSG